MILLVLLALLLYSVLGIGARQDARSPIDYSAHIIISADPSFFGTPLNVSVQMTCQPNGANLTLDGNPLAYATNVGGGGILATISPPAGVHQITAQSGPCRGSLAFTVLEPQCHDGEQESCENGPGCSGTQTCTGGEWGGCAAPPRICNPGQKVSCPINSCVFGLTYCNSCGTEWSECTAPAEQ